MSEKLQKRAQAQLRSASRFAVSYGRLVEGMNERTDTRYSNDPYAHEPDSLVLRRSAYFVSRMPGLLLRVAGLQFSSRRFERQWSRENPGRELPEELGELAVQLSGMDEDELLKQLEAALPTTEE